ncbi:MAG: dihydrofolate reductase, partial [Marinirhabdus sp.]
YKKEGAVVVHSIEAALKIAKDDPQPYVIGGGDIYRLALPFAHKIELTRVHGTFEADTYFPDIPKTGWEKTNALFHQKDQRHNYAFTYETWERTATTEVV